MHLPSTKLPLRRAAVAAVTGGALLATAASAHATIYIGGNGPNIQQAPLAGGKARTLASAHGGPDAIAATASSVYWSNNSGNGNVDTINRVSVSGRGYKGRFVKGANSVDALATTTSTLFIGLENSIGTAKLSGLSPKLNLIPNTGNIESIAIGGGYVYWTASEGTTIGRANLDGSSANPSFMTVSDVNDIAVSPQGIYWSNDAGTAIGKANLDGSSPNPSFITGMAQVGEVAAYGKYLYWTDAGGQIGPCNGPSCIPSQPGATAGSIDRATLAGTGMTKIVKGLNNPFTLAVVADPKRR